MTKQENELLFANKSLLYLIKIRRLVQFIAMLHLIQPKYCIHMMNNDATRELSNS